MSNIFGKCEGSFVKGKKDGQWTYYNFKGKRIRTETWEEGELLKTVER
jgi:antitoxin component YwqK of YwqJK toxin-antitoxin module